MKKSKNLSAKLCAVISATALATAAVVTLPSTSNAALSDPSLTRQHGDDLGRGPEASITLHTDKQKVKPGDEAVAHVELKGQVPFPESGTWRYGESDATAVIFELQVDKKLTVHNADQLAFQWGDGQTRTPASVNVDDEHNAIMFEFTPAEGLPLGPNPTMTVDIPVTVSEEAEAGEDLGIAVATEVDIRPTLDWTWSDWDMSPAPNGDACLRLAKGDLRFENPGQYGTWLADLWLGADNNDFELEGPASFRVTDKNGSVFTDKVFKTANYPHSTAMPSATPEIWTGADGADFAYYRWLHRYQWSFNEERMAGDVWIPEGSTIHIEQLVRSKSCNFDPNRKHFGAKVESRNSPLFKQDTARAALTVAEEPTTTEGTEEPTPTTTEGTEEPTPTTTEGTEEPTPTTPRTPEQCVPSTVTTTVTPSETPTKETETSTVTSTTTTTEVNPCPPVTVTSTPTMAESTDTPTESTISEPSGSESTSTPETSTPAPKPSQADEPTPELSASVESQDSPSSRVLANTGANVKTLAGLALTLVAAALMLLWFARRKES